MSGGSKAETETAAWGSALPPFTTIEHILKVAAEPDAAIV